MLNNDTNLKTLRSSASKALLFSALILTTTACQTFTGGSSAEGIGYRQARFAEIAAMNEFRQCRDDAVLLDEQARNTGSVAKYLASARLLEKCETMIGSDAANVGEDERIRAYALSIQNYIKGGDVSKAAHSLQAFQSEFPNKDLYYEDGSSFVETMLVLTHQKENGNFSIASTLNVSRDLKREKNRQRYWNLN